VLGTVRGAAWWRTAKHVGFVPEFVADVDAMLARHAEAPATQAPRSPPDSALDVMSDPPVG